MKIRLPILAGIGGGEQMSAPSCRTNQEANMTSSIKKRSIEAIIWSGKATRFDAWTVYPVILRGDPIGFLYIADHADDEMPSWQFHDALSNSDHPHSGSMSMRNMLCWIYGYLFFEGRL